MNNVPAPPPCRICANNSRLFYDGERPFFKCPVCSLIFADPLGTNTDHETHYRGQWPTQTDEFWSQQADVITHVMKPFGDWGRILDFGCGSGGLVKAFSSRGIDITGLDPMSHGFLADQNYPAPFDTVIALEVIEHIEDIHDQFVAIEAVIRPGAKLFATTLQTNLFINAPDAADQFAEWWYKDDPTHVSFFCNDALAAFGDIRKWKVGTDSSNLVVATFVG